MALNTLTTLIRDLAQALGLSPAPLALAGIPRRDPSSGGLWRNCPPAPQSQVEHFMNNSIRSTTMWRDTDTTRPPARPARTHSGHRPRITSGQRLAQALFDCAGPLARLVRHGETQWASATFTGSRHTFVLRFQGAEAVEAAEHLTAMIGDDEITIQGALIAEITVTRFTQTLLPQPEAEIEISALLLDQ
jgi:hypothetical protein